MHDINRRALMKRCSAAALAMMAPHLWALPMESNASAQNQVGQLKNNIHHSVCRWTFSHLSLPELCGLVKQIGFSSIDLVGPKEWSVLKEYGIHSSMCNGAELGLKKGWNDTQYHATLIKNYMEHIELVAKSGYQNLICFTGNRGTIDDETGMKNCVDGLKKIMSHAEKHGVVLHMEILNSRIDHKDYMADRSDWAFELCQRIGSPSMKMLFDIYHVQINEGDIIRRLQKYAPFIGHYHTGGVPGRGEITEAQELNYRAIMKAIQGTGFQGHVAQEFSPAGETPELKAQSLQRAILLCDV
jgi:hydroxypyruvate isomerase